MSGHKRQRGWIGTLAALALLIVVGFVCGALAGFLWEEPRLVVAYLTGRTETVDWSEPPAAAPGEPSVASPPPVAAAPPAPASRAPAPRAEAPPAARPDAPPRSGFAVQVGAFGERGAAERLAERLREHGYDSYLSSEGGAPWRVRVGPLPAREQAEALAQRLKRAESLPTWVLEEGEG